MLAKEQAMQSTQDVADRVAMDLFRTTLEKGHKFVLCVESAALSTWHNAIVAARALVEE